MEPYSNVLNEMSVIDRIKEEEGDNRNRRIIPEEGYLKKEQQIWSGNIIGEQWGHCANSLNLTYKKYLIKHIHIAWKNTLWSNFAPKKKKSIL